MLAPLRKKKSKLGTKWRGLRVLVDFAQTFYVWSCSRDPPFPWDEPHDVLFALATSPLWFIMCEPMGTPIINMFPKKEPPDDTT